VPAKEGRSATDHVDGASAPKSEAAEWLLLRLLPRHVFPAGWINIPPFGDGRAGGYGWAEAVIPCTFKIWSEDLSAIWRETASHPRSIITVSRGRRVSGAAGRFGPPVALAVFGMQLALLSDAEVLLFRRKDAQELDTNQASALPCGNTTVDPQSSAKPFAAGGLPLSWDLHQHWRSRCDNLEITKTDIISWFANWPNALS
jgi:hypothetical protein